MLKETGISFQKTQAQSISLRSKSICVRNQHGEEHKKKLYFPFGKCDIGFRSFIRATIKVMEIYVQPITNDDTPDAVILHIGYNDTLNNITLQMIL